MSSTKLSYIIRASLLNLFGVVAWRSSYKSKGPHFKTDVQKPNQPNSGCWKEDGLTCKDVKRHSTPIESSHATTQIWNKSSISRMFPPKDSADDFPLVDWIHLGILTSLGVPFEWNPNSLTYHWKLH